MVKELARGHSPTGGRARTGALVCSTHCLYLVHRARLPPAVYMVVQLEFLPAGPRPVAIFSQCYSVLLGREVIVMARPGGFNSDQGLPLHQSSPSPGSYGSLRPGALGARAYSLEQHLPECSIRLVRRFLPCFTSDPATVL